MTTPSEGWAFPNGARKAHYFTVEAKVPDDRAGFSLCGGYGFFFNREALEAANQVSKDDCTACRKKIDKRGQHVSYA